MSAKLEERSLSFSEISKRELKTPHLTGKTLKEITDSVNMKDTTSAFDSTAILLHMDSLSRNDSDIVYFPPPGDLPPGDLPPYRTMIEIIPSPNEKREYRKKVFCVTCGLICITILCTLLILYKLKAFF